MKPQTFHALLSEAQELRRAGETYLRRLTALREVLELSGTKDQDDRPDEDDAQTFRCMLIDLRELADDL